MGAYLPYAVFLLVFLMEFVRPWFQSNESARQITKRTWVVDPDSVPHQVTFEEPPQLRMIVFCFMSTEDDPAKRLVWYATVHCGHPQFNHFFRMSLERPETSIRFGLHPRNLRGLVGATAAHTSDYLEILNG